MKLTRIPEAELTPEFRAAIEEMVAANHEKVAHLRRIFGRPSGPTSQPTSQESAGPSIDS